MCGSPKPDLRSIPGGYLSIFLVYCGMLPKIGGNAESIRGGQTMPYAIRGSCKS